MRWGRDLHQGRWPYRPVLHVEGGRLQVTLRRFKDREIDYAARHLCEDLNRMRPVTLDKFQFPIQYQIQ